MRIRPTELGWKGLLLLAALECAFVATSYSNLFFLLIVFCIAVGTLAATWTIANLRGLRVVRVDVPLAAAGDARTVACELQARRPRSDLHLELLLDGASLPTASAPFVANSSTVTGTLPPRERGVGRVRGVRVTSRFPLGLFVARVDLPAAGDVATYPEPEGRRAGRRGAADGAHNVQHVQRGAGVQELRPFRAGDSLGDVHWKATARRGEPVVKEREREGSRARVFVLDRRCAPDELERALGVLAGAVLDARAAGGALRVLSQDAAFVVDAARGEHDAVLRWLASADTLDAGAAPPPRAAGALRLPAAAAEVRA